MTFFQKFKYILDDAIDDVLEFWGLIFRLSFIIVGMLLPFGLIIAFLRYILK